MLPHSHQRGLNMVIVRWSLGMQPPVEGTPMSLNPGTEDHFVTMATHSVLFVSRVSHADSFTKVRHTSVRKVLALLTYSCAKCSQERFPAVSGQSPHRKSRGTAILHSFKGHSVLLLNTLYNSGTPGLENLKKARQALKLTRPYVLYHLRLAWKEPQYVNNEGQRVFQTMTQIKFRCSCT